MKILIPILSFGREGGYKVLSKLANEFIRLGHQVDFLVPYFSPLPYHSTNASIFWVDKKGKWLADRPEQVAPLALWKSMYMLWLGLRNAQHSPYDIVLANHSLSTFPVHFSSVIGNRIYYVQAYESEYYKELKGIKNRILEWISKKSYSLPFKTVVNSNLYRNYKEINSSDVVYPGIDLDIYYPKIVEAHSDRKIRIGTIARREPNKGTGIVIEAYKKIFETRKDIELLLAFGDEEFADKELNIFVCAPHGQEQLSAFYRHIDVYICALTAQHGAVHYPVIESMASGTALITTDFYPANNTNAYMVEPFSSDSIVNAFNELIGDYEKTHAKIERALQDVQEFTWKNVSKKMTAILESTLK